MGGKRRKGNERKGGEEMRGSTEVIEVKILEPNRS